MMQFFGMNRKRKRCNVADTLKFCIYKKYIVISLSIASLLIYTSKFSALLLLENMKRQKTDCFTISYADAFLVFLEGEDS